jgi:predicted deacetylase
MTQDWAVSLHDVAPDTWPACARLLELVEPFGAPVTLLVTPHFHGRCRIDEDPAFVRALRRRVARGDEIALHGYFHLDDGTPPATVGDWFRRRVITASEGEFAAIGAADARRRLADGTRLLARQGLSAKGFVAPAWLLGGGARTALTETSLAYTSTRDELYALPSFEAVRAPSLVYSTRASWRRAASRHWNRRRLARLAAEPRVRVALHPADAAYPEVLQEWTDLLGALARARQAVLESAWLPVRTPSASAPARPRGPASPVRAAAGSFPCRRGSLPLPSHGR